METIWDKLLDGLISQLIERRTSTAKVMGSNIVEAWGRDDDTTAVLSDLNPAKAFFKLIRRLLEGVWFQTERWKNWGNVDRIF